MPTLYFSSIARSNIIRNLRRAIARGLLNGSLKLIKYEVIIGKQRHRPTGTIELQFDVDNHRNAAWLLKRHAVTVLPPDLLIRLAMDPSATEHE